jgi:hypothetical protein
VGPRTGLAKCVKSRPHRNSIPGRCSPLQVAISTELPRPTERQSTVLLRMFEIGDKRAAEGLRVNIMIFWVVMPRSLVDRYQHFGGN